MIDISFLVMCAALFLFLTLVWSSGFGVNLLLKMIFGAMLIASIIQLMMKFGVYNINGV